jgi:1-deoxy-D-xylulose-5-phosphate synthase
VALLDHVKVPSDVRRLRREELRALADELRERHIDVVAKKGGHFGASLGVVELTVALHYVYDTPKDKLVWDTGHQAYIHKMITGRNDRFETIRQRGGLAPFLRRDESPYDAFGAGHAATSVSAAWGMAVARDLNGDDYDVLAIIGDGAMGCGLAYEALNNAGHTQRDFTVILNDNEMSIAPPVGALSKYLTKTITNPAYNKLREVVKDVLAKAPRPLGSVMEDVAGKIEDSVTNFLTPGMLFEALGFRYVGPVDGHDMDDLVDTLSRVRKMTGPLLVHVLTRKGKGFERAEADPWTWHAASPFDKVTGGAPKPAKPSRPRYQKVFGTALTELAKENPKIVAITAAMPDGTSTNIFWDALPDRYFDVGIAEGHGVTFAAGLATAGIRPYVAIYSTFLQRAYDSIVHDVALQDLPVVFCMDRAGIAGEDGPTHHGSLDIAYMLSVPGMAVTAPMNGTEMLGLMRTAADHLSGPFSIRWPRDVVPDDVPAMADVEPVPFGTWEVVRKGSGLAILAVGTMVRPALDAAQQLARDGVHATVVNCRFLKPYDSEVLEELAQRHTAFLTVEEGTVVNGFGAFMSRQIGVLMSGHSYAIETLGMPDVFAEHGGRDALLSDMGLDAKGIAAVGGALAERMGVRGTALETA